MKRYYYVSMPQHYEIKAPVSVTTTEARKQCGTKSLHNVQAVFVHSLFTLSAELITTEPGMKTSNFRSKLGKFVKLCHNHLLALVFPIMAYASNDCHVCWYVYLTSFTRSTLKTLATIILHYTTYWNTAVKHHSLRHSQLSWYIQCDTVSLRWNIMQQNANWNKL